MLQLAKNVEEQESLNIVRDDVKAPFYHTLLKKIINLFVAEHVGTYNVQYILLRNGYKIIHSAFISQRNLFDGNYTCSFDYLFSESA